MEITVLHAGRTPGGNVVCWFTKKGRGAPDWQSFVDGFERHVEEVRKKHRKRVLRPDGTMAMSRGARMLLTGPVFLGVLRALKRDDVIAGGLSRHDFQVRVSKGLASMLSEVRRSRRDNSGVAHSSKRPLLPSETESTNDEETGESL
jgi:hypothetical protein